MTWDSAPGWLALLVSAGAVWVSLLARRDTKRSADADEAAVALQRAEAEERRRAAQPRPCLALELLSTGLYLLRNQGDGPAVGLRLLTDGLPPVVEGNPDGVTLGPQEGRRFRFASGWAPSTFPAHVLVTWDGLEAPVALPLEVRP